MRGSRGTNSTFTDWQVSLTATDPVGTKTSDFSLTQERTDITAENIMLKSGETGTQTHTHTNAAKVFLSVVEITRAINR